jgi:hypothetical protein
MLSFFEHTFNIGPVSGGPTMEHAVVDITRPNPDPNARVILVLKSFDVRFTDADHHLLRVFVRPEVMGNVPFTNTVPIRLSMGMRDSSGSWNDQYEGTIRLGIIAVDDNRVDVFEGTEMFDSRGGLGPLTQNHFLQLNHPSTTGVTFLRGFEIGFERDDHPVLQVMADVDDQTIGAPGTLSNVVQCRLGLRDDSGFWDDPYGGAVHFSSLRFPIETYEMEDGVVTVTNVNDGPTRGTGNHFIQQNVPPDRVFVGLTGFQASYIGGEHNIHRLISQAEIDQVQNDDQGTSIQIAYTGGIRDRSGDWNDQYASTGLYVILVVTDQVLNLRIPIDLLRRVRPLPRFRRVFPR